MIGFSDLCFASEKEKVRLYREKISKWQSQVSGRLQALGKRTGEQFDSQFLHIGLMNC